MKATPEQLATVQSVLSQFDTDERRRCYLSGDFSRADKVKDLNKRYRWDIYWLARDNGLVGYELLENLNDSQKDTVLRRVIPNL
jgi:hypothetical protein